MSRRGPQIPSFEARGGLDLQPIGKESATYNNSAVWPLQRSLLDASHSPESKQTSCRHSSHLRRNATGVDIVPMCPRFGVN
jgi:hypothetical protein